MVPTAELRINYSKDKNTNVTEDNTIPHLLNTDEQLPDYTNPGSSSQLFDFDRYIAASKAMGTYYANDADFKAALQAAPVDASDGKRYFEGIIVVDNIAKSGGKDPKWKAGAFPAINIRGTLLLNFGPGWVKDDKLFIAIQAGMKHRKPPSLKASENPPKKK